MHLERLKIRQLRRSNTSTKRLQCNIKMRLFDLLRIQIFIHSLYPRISTQRRKFCPRTPFRLIISTKVTGKRYLISQALDINIPRNLHPCKFDAKDMRPSLQIRRTNIQYPIHPSWSH
jgi:hypothetical protein